MLTKEASAAKARRPRPAATDGSASGGAGIHAWVAPLV